MKPHCLLRQEMWVSGNAVLLPHRDFKKAREQLCPGGHCFYIQHTSSGHLGDWDTRLGQQKMREEGRGGWEDQVLNATVENWTSQCETALLGDSGGFMKNKSQYCLNYFSWDLSEAVIWSRKHAYWCNGQSWGATERVAIICWVPLVCSLKIKWY